MRTKYTSGPPVTNKIGNEFVALPSDAGQRTTHYTRQGDDLHIPHQLTDAHAFSETGLLTGKRILEVAETHSNKQISEMIRLYKGKALSDKAVGSRIRNALKARAKAQGITASEAASALQQVRKANGVNTRIKKTAATEGDKKDSGAIASQSGEKDVQAADAADSDLSDFTEFESETEA